MTPPRAVECYTSPPTTCTRLHKLVPTLRVGTRVPMLCSRVQFSKRVPHSFNLRKSR